MRSATFFPAQQAAQQLVIVSAVLLTLFAPPSLAANAKSPNDAVAMVKKAAATLRKQGRDKAIAEFNAANKAYLDGEVYLFVLQNDGLCLVNTGYPNLVGKNLLHIFDTDGVQPTVEILKAANSSKQQGWVSYRWPHPISHKIVRKRTYVEKVGDLVVGAGVSAKTEDAAAK